MCYDCCFASATNFGVVTETLASDLPLTQVLFDYVKLSAASKYIVFLTN
jgi:hypothetical protein